MIQVINVPFIYFDVFFQVDRPFCSPNSFREVISQMVTALVVNLSMVACLKMSRS